MAAAGRPKYKSQIGLIETAVSKVKVEYKLAIMHNISSASLLTLTKPLT